MYNWRESQQQNWQAAPQPSSQPWNQTSQPQIPKQQPLFSQQQQQQQKQQFGRAPPSAPKQQTSWAATGQQQSRQGLTPQRAWNQTSQPQIAIHKAQRADFNQRPGSSLIQQQQPQMPGYSQPFSTNQRQPQQQKPTQNNFAGGPPSQPTSYPQPTSIIQHSGTKNQGSQKLKLFTAKDIIILFKEYQNYVSQKIHSGAKINIKEVLVEVMRTEFNISKQELDECLKELKLVIREDKD